MGGHVPQWHDASVSSFSSGTVRSTCRAAADPEFCNRGGGLPSAEVWIFTWERWFFGAFWDDFLRPERHNKRHTKPAVLILYHSYSILDFMHKLLWSMGGGSGRPPLESATGAGLSCRLLWSPTFGNKDVHRQLKWRFMFNKIIYFAWKWQLS